MLPRTDVVVDFKGWNRSVSEVRVAWDGVVIDQIVVRRKRNQCLDLQRDGIHHLRGNHMAGKPIADARAIRRLSCRSRIVNCVSKNATAQWVDSGLAAYRQLW